MQKTLLIATALLLSTSTFALSIPSGRHAPIGEVDRDAPRATSAGRFVLAGEREEHGRRELRRHVQDDDEDDDDDDGAPAKQAADPNAPVPDNGLFTGKARPKVDVQ